jgi:hypothetical protein
MAYLALDVAIVVGLAVAAYTVNQWCVAHRAAANRLGAEDRPRPAARR